jgi:hypothetical protein
MSDTPPADEAMRKAAVMLWNQPPMRLDESIGDFSTRQVMTVIRALDAAGWQCVSRSPLLAAKNLAIALAAGSCSCGIKSPDAALHAVECRYRLAVDLIENIEEALIVSPLLVEP